METVKKAQAKFKSCTVVIEFATTLINKSLALVNEKLLNDVKFVNRQIDSKNVSKLKTPVLTVQLQNYMTLTSSLNLLISYGQNAAYDRKLVIRTLKRHIELKTKDDGKRANYIDRKLNLMEERIESSIAQLETIITSIKYFSTQGFVKGAEEPEERTPYEVKDLSDVAKYLSGMKSKIESTFAEVKSIMKPIRELFSKKGSYEAMLVQDFEALVDSISDRRIGGGLTNDYAESEAVTIGGTVYYGGYSSDSDLNKKMTWTEFCRSAVVGGDVEDDSLEMVNNNIINLFGVNSKTELAEFVDMPVVGKFEKFSEDLQLDKLLKHQLDLAMTKLPELEQYYHKHRDQYVMEDVTDEPELPDVPESNRTEDRLAYVCNHIRTMVNAIDEVDKRAIQLEVKKEFERVDSTMGSSDIEEEIDNLHQRCIDLCNKPVLNRKATKTEILTHLDAAENENTIMLLPRNIPKPKDGTVLGMADYLIDQQMSMTPGLESAEKTYIERSTELGEALKTMDYLMSPDEKDPCVCKAIGCVKAVLCSDLYKKLATTDKLKEKISKSKSLVLDKLGAGDITLYTNKVNTAQLNKLANAIV